jgi:multicomponent Na+:H+ antiporter subunit G
MTIRESIILLLAVIGTIFTLISAIGILRLPDVYSRMHSAGKATTLGVSCLLLGAGIYFGEGVAFRMVTLIILFLITAPIAATAMARAAYRTDRERHFILHYDDMAADRSQATPTPRDADTRG